MGTLSKKVKIKYEVDQRSAKRGLQAISTETVKVRTETKQATEQFKAFDRAVSRAAKNSSQIASTFGSANGAGSSLTATMSGLTSALAGPAGVAAALIGAGVAAAELNAKALELAERSAQVSAVFQNVPIPIEAARRATQGLVTDFDLARLASDAVSLGVTENAKDFGELSGALQKLGARRGVDALKSIEDGFTAIGRGSKEMLDNLGITLSISQAQQEYARDLGKTVKQLDDVERAEAFRVVATRKVIDAARDVTLTTDDASSAVRRFNIELQNIEDRALGGSVATISLAEGLRQVSSERTIDVQALRTYGGAVTDLRTQLRDLGVASSDIPSSIEALSKAAKAANLDVSSLAKTEEIRRLKQAKDPAFIREQQRAAAEKQALETARARLVEVEEEQAFLASNNQAIAQRNELQIEALRLQALIARATGDEERANQLARQAELAFLREQGRVLNETGPRRRGGRRDPYRSQRLEFQQQLTEAINAERLREFSQAVSLQRNYLADVKRFESELSSVRLAGMSRQRAAQAEAARLQGLQANQLQRDTELALAKAITDDARFDIEQNMFAAREQALERQIELEARVGERQALEDSLAQVRHERELSRIQEEQQAREGSMRRRKQLVADLEMLSKESLALGETIATASIKGAARQEKAQRAFAAAGLWVDGTVYASKAIGAFAGANYVQGAAYTAASINAFAKSSQLGGRGGNAGVGGGPTAAGAAFARGETPQRAVFRVDEGAPISVRDEVEGNPNNTGGATSNQSQGRTVQIGSVQILGAVDEETVKKLSRGIAEYEGRTN